MPLTDAAIRNAKPAAKAKRIFDGGGLYLEVSPRGGKWWRFKYRFGGKEKRISLGVYPEVGLKDARALRDDARKLVAGSVDPSRARKAKTAGRPESGSPTFEAVARDWHKRFSANWSKKHADTVIRRLERDVFPWLKGRPIRDVDAPEILVLLKRIEDRGALETAHRVRGICSLVFRSAIPGRLVARDPCSDLRGALPPTVPEPLAAITDPKAIGELLRAIDGYQGTFVTRCALRLAPLWFVRPAELRKAEWEEIDFDDALRRIPGDRMKMGLPQLVPLSRQALSILRELHPMTGAGRYLFPSIRTPDRPMSSGTILAALQRLGYPGDVMTGHGFRAMASTRLNEQGWNPDAIERQLAHVEGREARRAYNRAAYFDERREFMQWWADRLDELRASK